MEVWWTMFVSNMLISLIVLWGGWMMWKVTPKKISFFIGYRTGRSMKNMDTWKFANEHCGKCWVGMGIILSLVSVILHLLVMKASEDTVSLVGLVFLFASLGAIIASVFPTEKALKEHFDENGNRR